MNENLKYHNLLPRKEQGITYDEQLKKEQGYRQLREEFEDDIAEAAIRRFEMYAECGYPATPEEWEQREKQIDSAIQKLKQAMGK